MEDEQTISYEYIKQLARETGQKVTDLIPLAPQNDPFYTGTPGDWALAEWFAGLWRAFRYSTKVHIRRVHYQIISQKPPVMLPNGRPYENTEECWNILNLASKAARYLHLVDPAAFNDKRNPDPVVYASHRVYEPQVHAQLGLWASDLSLPDFPELPTYQVRDFKGTQRYHLEVWCEKSTMNDVLVPLCRSYSASAARGGEASTHLLRLRFRPGGAKHAGGGVAQDRILCAHAGAGPGCARVPGGLDSGAGAVL